MQFIEQWPGTCLALSPALLGRLVADVGFDGVQLRDALQCLRSYGARRAPEALVQISEAASCMGPARGLDDASRLIQLAPAAVGIGLQHAVEGLEVSLRMLALAI